MYIEWMNQSDGSAFIYLQTIKYLSSWRLSGLLLGGTNFLCIVFVPGAELDLTGGGGGKMGVDEKNI